MQAIKDLGITILFDVGANIGAYSILVASLDIVDTVYGFEAEQEAYTQFCNNIQLNKMDSKIAPRYEAVSNVNEEVVFGVADPMGGINGVISTTIHKHDMYKQQRKVQAITLDSEFKIKNKNLCFKIDVEGHELAVILGARQLLKDNKCFIQVELYREQEDLVNILTDLGYIRVLTVSADCYFTNFAWTQNDTLTLIERALAELTQCSKAQ
jgi:FkbM family methyltransferase